jgi:hypothetical protein
MHAPLFVPAFIGPGVETQFRRSKRRAMDAAALETVRFTPPVGNRRRHAIRAGIVPIF